MHNNSNNFNSKIDYWLGIQADINEELDMFEKYVLPVFLNRGYTKGQALDYYTNRQVEEAVDDLIDRVDNNNGDEKKPWET